MQARTNDIRVEDVPTKLDNQSKPSIILDAENIIPIYYHGPIPYIHTRYPTDFDMNTYTGFELSANSSWNLYETYFNLSSTNCRPEIHSGNSISHNTKMIYDAVIDGVSVSEVICKNNDEQFLLYVNSNSVLIFDFNGVPRVVSAPRRLNYSSEFKLNNSQEYKLDNDTTETLIYMYSYLQKY